MTNEALCTVYLVAVLWGLTQINSLKCALITRTPRSIHCLTWLLSFSTLPTTVKHPGIKPNTVQANVWDSRCYWNVCNPPYERMQHTIITKCQIISDRAAYTKNKRCCSSNVFVSGEIKHIAQIYRMNNINLFCVWISQNAVCFQHAKGCNYQSH